MRLVLLARSGRSIHRFGDVEAAKPRKRKWNRLRPPRVCCSVCRDERVESAPDQLWLSYQHLLNWSTWLGISSGRQDQGVLFVGETSRMSLPIDGASSRSPRSSTTSLNKSIDILSTNISVSGTSQVVPPGNLQELCRNIWGQSSPSGTRALIRSALISCLVFNWLRTTALRFHLLLTSMSLRPKDVDEGKSSGEILWFQKAWFITRNTEPFSWKACWQIQDSVGFPTRAYPLELKKPSILRRKKVRNALDTS